MCGCTHADPAQCECGVNGPCCRCSCHRYHAPATPREPLAERDARIDQLRNMLASLARYVRVNVLSQCDDPYLENIVAQAEYTVKGEQE